VSYPSYRTSIEYIAVDGDAVFFDFDSATEDLKLKRYLNGVTTDVFVVGLKGAASAGIEDIAVADGYGWAVGYREFVTANGDASRYEPLLIKYDGSKWREVEINGTVPEVVFRAAAPINPYSCWLLVSESPFGRGPKSLWKFERGYLVEYPSVVAQAVTYDGETGITYALVLNAGVIETDISPDGGASWVTEKIKPETAWPTYEPDDVAAYANAGVLYVATSDVDGVPFAGAVFRRTGPPGAAYCELLFYSPGSGNFSGFEGGISADGHGRILAVGNHTSAFYDGVRWVREGLPSRNDFYDVTVGRSGFYAVASDDHWNLQILYHP